IERDETIDNLVNGEVNHLEEVNDHISSCRVSIEKPNEHIRSGSPYRVRIDVTVPPRHEIVSKQEPGQGDMHEALSTVILNVFDGARRQLQELNERQGDHVKRDREPETNAIVNKVFHDEGYGFLKSLEGRDIYFHRNSVLNNDFDRLAKGTGVYYSEEMGEKGLQASSLRIVDKPGVRRENAPEELPGFSGPHTE
ncbi:MAG: cold shock domain-containing protein, partial [Spirochaetota bacterium]